MSIGIFEHISPGTYSVNGSPIKYPGKALHGDLIKHSDGEILEILERPKDRAISGVLRLSDIVHCGTNKRGYRYFVFQPLSWKFPPMYTVFKNYRKYGRKNIYVSVKFSHWGPELNNPYPIGTNPYCSIEKIFKSEDEALLAKNSIFTKPYKLEKMDMVDPELFPVDHDNIIVIDPEGSVDFDDGFSLEEGKIFVHIADPLRYLDNSDVEKEIQNRLCSIYSPEKTYHMLPEWYMEKVSLNKNGKKFALTVEFDNNMNFVSLKETVVLVKSQVSYEKVNLKILQPLFELCSSRDPHKIIEFLMVNTNKVIGNHLNKLFRVQKGLDPAYYSLNPGMHDILGIENYTHFTSPMRRYVDLLLHHVVKDKDYTIEQETIDKINTYYSSVKRYYRDSFIVQKCKSINESGMVAVDAIFCGYDTQLRKLVMRYENVTLSKYFKTEQDFSLYRIGDIVKMKIVARPKEITVNRKLDIYI